MKKTESSTVKKALALSLATILITLTPGASCFQVFAEGIENTALEAIPNSNLAIASSDLNTGLPMAGTGLDALRKKIKIDMPRADAYGIAPRTNFVPPASAFTDIKEKLPAQAVANKETSATPEQTENAAAVLSSLNGSGDSKNNEVIQQAAFDGKSRPIRVVVLGGGISGMAAIDALARKGIKADLYEMDPRHFGGRIRSEVDPQTGLIVEGAAELVHSNDHTLKKWLRRFGIDLIPRDTPSSKHLFHIGKKTYSYRSLMNKLFAEAPDQLRRIKEDKELVESERDYLQKTRTNIDLMSIKEYLDSIQAPPLLRAFLDMVISPEYGENYKELSATILLESIKISAMKSKNINIYPLRKEAYKVVGGTQRIIDAVVERHHDSLHLGHRLKSIFSKDAKTFRLTFETSEGLKAVEADYVINTIPLPSFKGIKIKIPRFPKALRKELQSVQYGSNGKQIMLFKTKFWRMLGSPGEGFSNLGLSYWDASEGQDQTPAGALAALVNTSGLKKTDVPRFARSLAKKLLNQLKVFYPEILSYYLGYRFYNWPTSFSGSDKPGQRTGLNIPAEPIGNYFPAGEFYGDSEANQSFMEGAVTSIIRIVRAIPRKIRAEPKKDAK